MKFDKSAENLIKFDKKLMEEPTKISSFWNFCQFRSEFEAFFYNKLHLSLQRCLFDNGVFTC